MIEAFLAKMRRYNHVGVDAERAFASIFTTQIDHARGDMIVQAGQELSACTLLLSGFVHRFMDLPDGRRQSLELSIPGDFVDLHALITRRVDQEIGCLSPCRVTRAPHARIRELVGDFPQLSRLLWLHTAVDAALHRERIMSLGARRALERLAHFLCETTIRLRTVGLGDESGFELPLTHRDLGEFLGLSTVHISRTHRELRERGLAKLGQGEVRILDWHGLAELAHFDGTYLGRLPQH